MKKQKLTNLLETADQLRVPAKWLKEAALSGDVPCLKIGSRKILFDPQAVEAAMVSLARKPAINLSAADTDAGGNTR